MGKGNTKFETEEKNYIKLGFFVLIVFFGSLLIWALTAKIDTVVIAPGKLVVKSYKKPVEYKEWGEVSKVFVKEGDFVKEGQPLIELQNIEPKTSLNLNKIEYYQLLAARDRLRAEESNLNYIPFSKEFLSLKDKALKEKIIKTQKEVFNSRRKKINEELSYIEKKKEEIKKQIEGYKELLNLKKEQLSYNSNELNKEKKLLEQGLTDERRYYDLKDKILDLRVSIKDLQNKIKQGEIELEKLNKEKEMKIKEYQADISSQLEKVTFQLNQIKPKLKLYSFKVKKTIIKAPASGQVIGLKVKSIGQTIKPGDTLMYIVPKQDEMFITAKINPQDRDKVRTNQFVDLRFPAFISIGANAIEGKVIYVSSDTLFDEISKHEYYEAHIKLTEKGLNQVKHYGFQLVPGMPAVAYIKVEKITPFEYIMQPVIIMFKSAFKSN